MSSSVPRKRRARDDTAELEAAVDSARCSSKKSRKADTEALKAAALKLAAPPSSKIRELIKIPGAATGVVEATNTRRKGL